MNEMAVIIAQSALFKSLSEEARADVMASGYVCAFAEGATILEQGNRGDTMYLVLNGTVSVTAFHSDANFDLGDLGRGACVGEVSVITGNPRTATVVAKTAVDLVAFKAHRIHRMLDENPKVRAMLESLIEGRAHDALSKMVGP